MNTWYVLLGKPAKLLAATALIAIPLCGARAQKAKDPDVVKVPCRDMGDGRTLIDSLCLPDWVDLSKSRWTVVARKPASMKGEWANFVCTIRLTE
jgi:hypothetical protein